MLSQPDCICQAQRGDYDDGGQYCIGFGGATVDHRISDELLEVISPLGVAASLKAIEELSAGDTAQRAALSRKLEALEYEAKRAFEQYDVVDARNRLAAAELERRWNEKLHEIETVKEHFPSSRKGVIRCRHKTRPTYFRWVRTSPRRGITATALPQYEK